MNITEKDLYMTLQNTRQPIILYGTGNGADKVLDELQRRRISVSGVVASDAFVRGQSFREFPVRRLSEVEGERPLLLICFGSERPEVLEHLLSLTEGFRVLCPVMPVYGDTLFDREYFEAHRSQLEEVCGLLADPASVKVLEQIINFRLSGELSFLTASYSSKEEAFRKLLCLGEEESYLDLGAYRGDTIEEFLYYTGGKYRQITALEPDTRTYRKLREQEGHLSHTRLFHMGIWKEDTELPFEDTLGRGSSIQDRGSSRLVVTTVDTLYARQRLTYLKADVEGAEEEMLLGGQRVIARDKPKVNLALYHRSEDLFKLPLLLKSIQPEYRIFLRQHPHIPDWDLNLYGI